MSTPKKLYETILSSRESTPALLQCLQCLIRLSIDSCEHRHFLLHRLDWFNRPLCDHVCELTKVIRLERGGSKQAARVGYNLLCEALSREASSVYSLQCLQEIFQDSSQKQSLLECLKENYPHKLAPLSAHLPYMRALLKLAEKYTVYRTILLEVVFTQLVSFDTEILLGDEFIHRLFLDDSQVLQARLAYDPTKHELTQKGDELINFVLGKMITLSQKDPSLLAELFSIFQTKVLPVKSVKLVQLVLFAVCESSKANANELISFLLRNIFKSEGKENCYRLQTQSHFYLSSYLARSKRISEGGAKRAMGFLVRDLRQRMSHMSEQKLDEKLDLQGMFVRYEKELMLLQTIILAHLQRGLLVEEIQDTLDLCRHRIHWEVFLRSEIIEKLGFTPVKQGSKLKFSNKLLPSILPQLAKSTDCLFGITPQILKLEEQERAKWSYKRCREDAQVSANSETGV